MLLISSTEGVCNSTGVAHSQQNLEEGITIVWGGPLFLNMQYSVLLQKFEIKQNEMCRSTDFEIQIVIETVLVRLFLLFLIDQST